MTNNLWQHQQQIIFWGEEIFFGGGEGEEGKNIKMLATNPIFKLKNCQIWSNFNTFEIIIIIF